MLLLVVMMRVHPAAMERGNEMRQLRLQHQCFLKGQEGIMMPHNERGVMG